MNRKVLVFLLLLFLMGIPVVTDAVPTAYVNTSTFAIPLQVSDIGPAGVREVELHLSRDQGLTWRKVRTFPYQAPSPITFEATEGDGQYGFFAVVIDGVGHRTPVPADGTGPIYYVWLDTTPPQNKISEPQGGEQWFGGDSCRILWQASDLHLAEKPVTLSVSQDGGKSWQILAPGQEAAGSWSWTLPDLDSTEILVKVESRDLAGNLTASRIPLPMTVRKKKPAPGTALPDTSPPPAPPGTLPSQTDQQRAILACSEGSAHRANGDFDKARQCLETAISLWPRYWEAINDLGVVYYHQQHFEKALEQFTAALAIKEDADLHLNLGLTSRSLGRPEQAIPHFRSALESLKDGPAAGALLWELARLELERRHTDEAVRYWEKIVQRADPAWSGQAAQLLRKYRPSAP